MGAAEAFFAEKGFSKKGACFGREFRGFLRKKIDKSVIISYNIVNL